jgi:outer membrane biosynthesis protein TonB
MNEMKNKIKGLTGTILFHAGLLFLLIFLSLRLPVQMPGGEGVYVNLGFDDTGMGSDQQEFAAAAEIDLPLAIPKAQQLLENEDYVVQNDEEAAAVEEKKPEIKKKEPEKIIKEPKKEPVKETVKQPEKVKEPEPQPQANPKAMYKGKNPSGKPGGGQEGITGQPGDQGVPGGTPHATTYTGTPGAGNGTGVGSGTGTGQGDGSGDGIAYSLGTRGSLHLFKPSYDSQEQGTVVVKITVDRLGNVISAAPGAKGTNVSDLTLQNLAKNAALQSKFVADPDAPESQTGTITYKFIRQN